MRLLTATLTGILASLTALAAQAQGTNNSVYCLFNPVPDDQLRPLSSSTYDGVTDARTLDAGHFQVESALLNYYYYHDNPVTANEFIWEPRITVGLLNNVDFFVSPAYSSDYFKSSGGGHPPSSVNLNEFENTATGVKINLWGNDGGTTAFSIQPYLNLPTSQNMATSDDVLGGGDLALLVRLPCEFSVKLDSQFYATEFFVPDEYTLYAGFDNSMSINKTLCAKADAYWYLNTSVTTDSAQPWSGFTGFGLDYNFTPNLQLFAGIGFGLNTSADLYNPRLGFVWRF